jgi:hypothetical protein
MTPAKKKTLLKIDPSLYSELYVDYLKLQKIVLCSLKNVFSRLFKTIVNYKQDLLYYLLKLFYRTFQNFIVYFSSKTGKLDNV